MMRMKRTGTGPEVELRRALWAAGLRYRVNFAPLPGLRTRADIALLGPRVLVYVDGCFWHGCPEHLVWPKNNADFWREKVQRNKERDARVTAALEAAGWTVIRVWEHEGVEEARGRVEATVHAHALPRP
jgi:DNA mismatch endonuclease (patch repair protein)